MKKLTPTQVKVLTLVAQGNTAKAIGRKLGMAYATARNHKHDAYKILGVNSAAEAVATAIFEGYITRETWTK